MTFGLDGQPEGTSESQSRHTSGRVYEVLGLWVSYLGKVVICLSERSD